MYLDPYCSQTDWLDWDFCTGGDFDVSGVLDL